MDDDMPEVYKTPMVSMLQGGRTCGLKGLEYSCMETYRPKKRFRRWMSKNPGYESPWYVTGIPLPEGP